VHHDPTRAALDHLADLLLTGPDSAPGPHRFPGVVLPQRRRKADLKTPPVAPAISSSAAPPSAPDIGYRLADFQSAPSNRSERGSTDAILLEAVLLGNLPGYASPWVSQYAAELSRSHRGVGLIRIDDRQVRVEVFRADDESMDPELAALAPSIDPVPRESFVQAVDRLSQVVDIWLAVIDPCNSPMARRRLADADRWTLLSGSDEAAVVAAYRLFKQLVEAPDAQPPARGVRMMFLGCDRQAALAALSRIDRAASSFLRVPVEFAGVRRQIQPLHRLCALQFDLEPAEDAWSQLVERLRRRGESEDRPDAAVEPAIPGATSAAGRSQAAVASPSPRLAPAPPAPAAASAPLSLTRFVPTLHAMQARCPRHPAVELAVDPAGRCHLLLQSAGEPADAAIRRLVETRLWAREHHDLLALTLRDRALAGDPPPQMHLFTDQPRQAIDYAAAAPPDRRDLKLHLLQSVAVGDAHAEVHVELN
jgi:hypothetical protein